MPGVRPAPIANPAAISAAVARGARGTVYGHGRTEHTDPAEGGMTDRLQRATMTLLPPKRCAADIPRDSVGDSGFCVTGVPEGRAAQAPSVCPGDSGGPLMLSTARGPEIAGVLSAQSDDNCDGGVHQGEFMNPGDWRQDALRPHPTLAPIGSLRITGTPGAGHRRTATVGALTPDDASVHYAWYQEKDDGDGFKYYVPIDGARSSTLTVTKDLAGKQLKTIATLTTRAGKVDLEQTTKA